MPKVRDSSGTIGTTRLPICLSRSSVVRIRTKAIVVEIVRSPVGLSWASNADSSGTGSVSLDLARRSGRNPPSASRRPRRYACSGLPSRARRNGRFGISSSGRSMPNRSRNERSTASPIFFCWWVMFWPSPASPMP